MADLDRAARIAVTKARFAGNSVTREDKHEVAWEAIATALYECGCGQGRCTRKEPLSFQDLLFVGMRAVRDDARAHLRMHGGTEGADTPQTPNYVKFWLPPRKSESYSSDGFSDGLLTRMVLRQALGTLTAEQWAALAALAALGSGHDAAGAMGVSYKTYLKRLGEARRQLVSLLTGDDGLVILPPPSDEVTCNRGHSRAQFGEPKTKSDGRTTFVCTECRRIMARRKIAAFDEEAKVRRRHDQKRHHLHRSGDHTLCLTRNCDEAPSP